jgi:hypothetical protein
MDRPSDDAMAVLNNMHATAIADFTTEFTADHSLNRVHTADAADSGQRGLVPVDQLR